MTTSGAITAITINFSRRKPAINHLSLAFGMLGWTATQVQPKIVTTQLQIIFQIVLQLCISLHKAGADWSMVTSRCARIGDAWALRLARKWMMNAINMVYVSLVPLCKYPYIQRIQRHHQVSPIQWYPSDRQFYASSEKTALTKLRASLGK